MRKKMFSEEQIALALRQAETGTPVTEVCRKIGVSEQSFYRWEMERWPHPSDRGAAGLRCRSGVGFMPPRCSCPAVQEIRADRSMLHRG